MISSPHSEEARELRHKEQQQQSRSYGGDCVIIPNPIKAHKESISHCRAAAAGGGGEAVGGEMSLLPVPPALVWITTSSSSLGKKSKASIRFLHDIFLFQLWILRPINLCKSVILGRLWMIVRFLQVLDIRVASFVQAKYMATIQHRHSYTSYSYRYITFEQLRKQQRAHTAHLHSIGANRSGDGLLAARTRFQRVATRETSNVVGTL